MNTILLLTLILVIAELFEATILRAENLIGVLQNLYMYYQKSIFLFFLIQPGFYIVLFIVLYTGILNISMIFLLVLKVFDMFYKIELIKKIFIEQKVSIELAQMLELKMPPLFYLLGVFMYPPMLLFALI